MATSRCFFDLSVEGELVGRVVFELYGNQVPLTVENFRSLCTGSDGKLSSQGLPMSYRSSRLHKVVAGFAVCGGDFILGNGKGGESIYGPAFDDEDLSRNIDEQGLLVMAHFKGEKNTNASQFFISLRPCPHLDGKHVVFGKVVSGYEIIEAISKLPVDEKDTPMELVTISNCGELERRKKVEVVREKSEESEGRSVSRSPSRSPTPEKKKRSRRSEGGESKRKHRERDENGNRIHKSRRSRPSLSSRPLSPPPLSAEEQAQRVQEKRIAEEKERVEEERARELEKERKEGRERELERLRKRYEAEGGKSGIVYKGRGNMKAPSNGNGGMRGW